MSSIANSEYLCKFEQISKIHSKRQLRLDFDKLQQEVHLPPKLVSARKLAAESGWPISRINKLKEARAIPFVKIGNCSYYPEDAISEFLAKNLVPVSDHVKIEAPNE